MNAIKKQSAQNKTGIKNSLYIRSMADPFPEIYYFFSRIERLELVSKKREPDVLIKGQQLENAQLKNYLNCPKKYSKSTLV